LAYQRPIDENFVRRAVNNFDKNEVETPCVSLRFNGKGEKEYRVARRSAYNYYRETNRMA